LPLNSKHTFVTRAIYGLFTDSIKNLIEENKIDLIVMGTKGATGLKKVTIGSNTGNVMTKVKCPILAVPEDAEYHHPREIAFPTDYHLNYNVKVLDDLRDLAIMHASALRFVYISQKGEEYSTGQLRNQRFLSDYFVDLEHTLHKITGQKLEAAVQCFTESREIDMIVMVAKNLNFLQRILFRPSVEKISYYTKIPFLVLHE
ncbi:MAG TPA: universal stress protein, partial [Eudoraea sp.]|nr:universal stress protein [Eudoraea sp.]